MATFDLPILGPFTVPDSTGKAFFEPLSATGLTLSTATLDPTLVLTIQAPATAGDCGIFGKFAIPQNYFGTPVLVVKGWLGEAANTLGFGITTQSYIDSAAIDVAYDAEDAFSNATWTGLVAGDLTSLTKALTPTYAALDEVYFNFYREDTADTQTGEFYVSGLFFRYDDA